LAEIERLKARITELEEEIESLRERLGEEAR
jgi:cell division protein FtsB